MKAILKILFLPFDLLVAAYKKVCSIRKDDTPAQENALFLMLMLLALMVAFGSFGIWCYFEEQQIKIPEIIHKATK